MEHNNDNSVLEVKIEEHLAKLHKRKIYAHHATPIAEDKQKLSKTQKWGIIKRQLQNNHQKLFVVKGIRPQGKQPPLDREDLKNIISRTLMLQHIIIRLTDTVGKFYRLPLLWIFFQCALSIIFNSYNLVLFLLKAALGNGQVQTLRIVLVLVFYGFYISVAFTETLITVIVHQCVHVNIRRTGSIMDELNLYITDDAIKLRLGQFSAFVYNNLTPYTVFGLFFMDGSVISSLISGTTTYIIILIQYSGDGEICKHPGNATTV